MMYIRDLYKTSFAAWKQCRERSMVKNEKKRTALIFWKACIYKRYMWLLRNWKSLVPDKQEVQKANAARKE